MFKPSFNPIANSSVFRLPCTRPRPIPTVYYSIALALWYCCSVLDGSWILPQMCDKFVHVQGNSHESARFLKEYQMLVMPLQMQILVQYLSWYWICFFSWAKKLLALQNQSFGTSVIVIAPPIYELCACLKCPTQGKILFALHPRNTLVAGPTEEVTGITKTYV